MKSLKEPRAIEPIYRALGARIEMLRTTLGWTQEELATKTKHVTRTSIVNIEAGRQRIMLHDLQNFADAFGCQLKVLLRGILF